MFNAFRFTELGDVKVVILGQDPYHGPGQHMVWRFPCVPDRSPPSLVNMYKELEASIPGFVRPAHGYLKAGRRSVLLLNTVLTVGQASAFSCQPVGNLYG